MSLFDSSCDPLLTLLRAVLVAIVAFLYAAVGHGGATGYLACLGLTGMPHEQLAASALILNAVVATISLFSYWRAGALVPRLALPFMITSVPFSFLGALVPVNRSLFLVLLGAVLMAASLRFLNFFNLFQSEVRNSVAPEPALVSLPLAASIGAGLGFVSGMVGIGGGVFLSPIILYKGWGDMRQTAAASALFIFANSVSGLLSRYWRGGLHDLALFPYLPVAVAAALFGAHLGARKFKSARLQIFLGLVLALASLRLFMEGFSVFK
ncbi:MAG: sulfite exporter TauE/SafE family protein [Candidatus Obscuribacterales bacterium]|nr:sulfite exporter TauE/SafE family protein [Candidatus Obscuribacterales bacterium]